MTMIKNISLFAVAVLLGANIPLAAQSGVALSSSGSLTAASASCLATNCVQIPISSNTVVAGVQIAGTFVGTLQFEGSVDGANFVAMPAQPIGGGATVTSATAAGVWQVQAGGLTSLRVRVSAYTSGTASVTVARSGAGPLANQVTLPSALTVTSLTSSGAVVGTSVRGAQSALTSASNSTTFDAAAANSFTVTLQENSTLTVSNPVAGRTIDALVCQDGTGSRTWSWGTVIKGGTTITSTASKCTAQRFLCDGTNCWAVAAAATNM